jgi:hypothetical protein
MNHSLKVTFASSAAVSLLAVLLFQRIPVAEPIVVPPPNKFDLAHNDTVRVVPLKKADLERPVETPKPVVIERVAALAPVAIPDPPPLPLRTTRRSRRDTSGNVCARHNMRKVVIGRSWRCRR